jgi:serine phosphatase RsbU (regulator of sigma subunit)
MTNALTYLLGPLVAAAWIRVRPPQRLGRSALHWVVGVILAGAVPGIAPAIWPDPGRTNYLPTVVRVIAFFGALLLLRALWFFATCDRPRGRGYPYVWGGLALTLVLPVLAPSAAPAFAILAAPWLWSFRWRRGLGARPLAFAGGLALITIILGFARFDPGKGSPWGAPSGLGTFAAQVARLATMYAAVAFPAAVARIHLSIRRIGRRLVGSHVLAAVIPFVLGIAFLLVAAGFFVATYRGSVAVRMLTQQSERARELLSVDIADRTGGPLDLFGEGARRQFVLVREGNGPTRVLGDFGASLEFSPDSLLQRDESSTEVPLLWDGRTLYLRARRDGTRPGTHGASIPVRIETIAEVDSAWMARVSAILGVPVRISPAVSVSRHTGGITIGPGAVESGTDEATSSDSESVAEPVAQAPDTAGRGTHRSIGPADGRGFRLPGGATVRCLRASVQGWSSSTIPVASSASFGENLSFFWSVGKENPLALAVLVVLGLIAFLFLSAIGIATGMVLDMGRSVTRAVRALTEGTRALREGKLGHRIAVEGHDELWDVAASFNEMAGNLEETRVRELAAQRMEEELRLARVIQDRLLPSGPPALDRLELAGMSLPAREVGGDYYDYLLLDDGRLGLAVADVSGKGTPAALLMSAFRASLRSQDLGALGPAEALARINRFIHSSVDPGKFITAFLALIDPATGEIRFANAGHDAPLIVSSVGAVSELTGGGLILGLLPQIVYEEARTVLDPGALLAIFTDGVPEARGPEEEFYGAERLAEVLCRHRARPCDEILHHLTEEIAAFSGTGPQSDDITVILARRRAGP